MHFKAENNTENVTENYNEKQYVKINISNDCNKRLRTGICEYDAKHLFFGKLNLYKHSSTSTNRLHRLKYPINTILKHFLLKK